MRDDLDDLVELRIFDERFPGLVLRGLEMTRDRAEALAEMGRERWPRYRFEIFPREVGGVFSLAFWLGLAEAALSFLRSHLWLVALIVAIVSAALAVYLPTAHLRTYPVVAMGVVCFGLGFLGSKATP